MTTTRDDPQWPTAAVRSSGPAGPPARATPLSVRRFTFWALETLEIAATAEGEDVYQLEVPLPHRAAFADHCQARFTFSPELAAADGAELVTADSWLFRWLWDELRQRGGLLHASPRRQIAGVHQITPRLFAAYQVDQGTMHLSGCQIEDRPLVRLIYRPAHQDGGHPETAPVLQVFASPAGQPLDRALLDALQLDDLQPFGGRRPRISLAEMTQWVEHAARSAHSVLPAGQPSRPELSTLIWCKYVEGQLSFVIGEHSAQLPFAGWAQLLADGQLAPPAYVCPWTGRRSYHLAATDDGRITVAEAIGTCAASGARVLVTELQACTLSGKQALPEYLRECPVTQQRLLRSLTTVCPMCRQEVSPQAMQGDRCQACRSLRSVSKDDPRMARLLGEYPRLDRWRRWKCAETTTAYILMASGLWQRLLIVLDKQTLKPWHAATRGPLARRWQEVALADATEYFA